jgi:hypothetical protein
LKPVEFAPLAKSELAAMAAQNPSGELAKILREEGDAEVTTASVALSSDNNPELILRFTGLDTCGARDCDTIALAERNGDYFPIWIGSSTSVAVGSEIINGWKPLVTNPNLREGVGTIWIWKEGKYVLQ